MGPGDTMSTTTMNSNSDSTSLAIPKLCDDGSNWADYEPTVAYKTVPMLGMLRLIGL